MIELKDVESYRKCVSALSGFISEGNFRFNDSGIHFRGIDPSQVVLVDFHMPASSFKSFEVEPSVVGVDLSELNKIVSRVPPSDSLMIDLTDFELKLLAHGEFEKQFDLPLIDVAGEEPAMPKVKFDATVEITGRVLKEALKDASVFGSLVVFKVKKNNFLVEAKGTRGNMSSISKESKEIKVSSTKDVVAKFSLNFLHNIVREVNPEDKVILELKNDSPVRVLYSIGGARLEFFLAHMIL